MIKPRLLLVPALILLFAISGLPARAAHDKLRAQPDSETTKKEDRIIGEDARLDNRRYQPDYCDFFAEFPTEPLKGRRCETGDDSRCYDLVSYTKVLGLSSTVRFDIICNPGDEKLFAEYTPEILKKTLRAMAEGNVTDAYEPQVREEKNYRQAGMIGRGRAGMGDTVYIAQIWISKRSIMAVEGEMMGEQTEEADELFATILRTIGYNETPEEKAEREKAEKEAAEKQKVEAEIKPQEPASQEVKPQEKFAEPESPAPQSTEP